MIRRILLTMFFLGGIGLFPLYGQNFSFGLSFQGGFPQGGFKNNVESNGFGVDGIVAYSLPASPVAVGLDLGFITYGKVRRTEPFSPNIPEVLVDVKTTNNIFNSHLFVRAEGRNGILRPYIDGLLGLNYLFTRSSVEEQSFDEPIASTTNFDDVAFSYGVGTGMKIKLAKSIDDETGKVSRWFLDLKARYLLGGEAEYLREGGLRNVNGSLVIDPSFSRTDLFTIGIGFSVLF